MTSALLTPTYDIALCGHSVIPFNEMSTSPKRVEGVAPYSSSGAPFYPLLWEQMDVCAGDF